MSTPIVMIDFETSGMSPQDGGRVTEVAAVRVHQGEIVERFTSLINCGVRIPSFITDLTGITQAMVNAAPKVNDVIPKLLDFIGDDYLAAHNASFDEKFLLAEASRLDLNSRHQGVICTVKLARRIAPGFDSYSLGPLAAQLGVRFNGRAHRALADAEAAAQVLILLQTRLRTHFQINEVHPSLLEKINRQSAAKVPEFLQKFQMRGDDMPTKPKSRKKAQPELYRHYKGGVYELICEATHEADLSTVVVYRASNGTVWTRLKSVFFETVVVDGQEVPRFARISSED